MVRRHARAKRGFSQGWAFLVLDAEDHINRFWSATTSSDRKKKSDAWLTGMKTAPLLILQTAVDAELGACFFGVPAEKVQSFRDTFKVPAAFAPVGAIAVGHPAAKADAKGSPARRPRRSTDEVVHYASW